MSSCFRMTHPLGGREGGLVDTWAGVVAFERPTGRGQRDEVVVKLIVRWAEKLPFGRHYRLSSAIIQYAGTVISETRSEISCQPHLNIQSWFSWMAVVEPIPFNSLCTEGNLSLCVHLRD